ncbi:PGF-CTERM-anchored ABC transporter substrate-binding protein [Halopiger goleimassiliensis]|uniref:PGF-CTERM-anchored ABC transporter substrate-binding protein n=1 Tax=Halopiger goleimassiliensis TaxID=1293048 RepID=UPI0006780815|nr:PGF-CTERM-anchored ABC transporter substrate-binding protein [Halopiger goleimassiliensis]
MRKLLIALLAGIVVLAAGAPAVAGSGGPAAATVQESPTCEYPLELEDATGETVTVDSEPESVVALQPSDAQIVHEIGAEDKLVGMPVGQYTDYLDADEDLDISEDDDLTPIAETVVDRDPDVVLAANTLEGDDVVDQLRDAGLTVYVFPTGESLDGVAENVRLTGQLVGACDGAQETLEWMDERLEVVEEAIDGEDRPLAYYAMGGGYTTGDGTFQHEILTTAGVENLGAETGITGWDVIEEETVVAEDPEWIVYGASAGEPPVSEGVQSTTAYENEQFVAVNDNFMSQPGPLVVEAIGEIASEVHPEAYDEAEQALEEESSDEMESESDGDSSSEETDEEMESDEDTDAEEEETAAESDAEDTIPGFGVPAGIVALLALGAGFARRR